MILTVWIFKGPVYSITSSTNKFLLQGEQGFTETTNRFDDKQRLVRSVSRGSDKTATGLSTTAGK
ncbi:hypothetical protein ACZ87_02707 [Candidatus Erwinia dacicola]|uniref:Uncharacterized protein n=1 Tax=Candidatus Erwinia dacicola TaxID=252393 RepID=A0A328TIP2_9GAMM|nr:hypothetical protein ACZ87_02707 [Candidatus Erwinia dacicola]